jgi:3D (Asp-Asp-Asp) domain-containing protein
MNRKKGPRLIFALVSLGLLFFGAACSEGIAQGAGVASGREAQGSDWDSEEPASFPLIGRFRNTFYYLAPEVDYDETLPRDVPVRTLDGTLLALVSKTYKRAMDIEGTGRLRDGRVINFAGVVEGEVRYAETIHPFGRGVGNCPLTPLRSIAVDRGFVELGSVVYIQETDGKRLPDGTLHDGLWRAEDVGGAIKRDRIDLFVGDGKRSGAILAEWGITHLQPLTLRMVSRPPEKNCTQETPR